MSPTSYALMITFRVWLIGIPIAALNAFVFMDRVYAPRVGAVRAHQLAMATRIVWIVILGFVIVQYAGEQRTLVWVFSGLFWMALWLVFEWAGSLLIRRRCMRSSSAGTSNAATCGPTCCWPTCSRQSWPAP